MYHDGFTWNDLPCAAAMGAPVCQGKPFSDSWDHEIYDEETGINWLCMVATEREPLYCFHLADPTTEKYCDESYWCWFYGMPDMGW